MRYARLAAIGAAAALLLALTACGPAIVRVDEPVKVTTKSIPLGSETALDAEIDMAVGQMHVSGGAAGIMDGRFESRPLSWEPVVRYTEEPSSTPTLRIEHPDPDRQFLREAHSVWDVKLNSALPLTLHVKTGVGTSTLDLGGMYLRSLDVDGGVGETIVDLGSKAATDTTIDINGGVGTIVLRVPREAGVRVFGHQDGVGDFSAEGFTKEGSSNVMHNAAYGTPGVKQYDVRIDRGVGDVTIEQL